MEVDNSTTHPNPQPNLHHRKIELQSPLDLTYLQANLSTAAQQKLDLYFPPTAYRPQPPPAKPAEFISLDGPSKDASTSQRPQLQPRAEQEQAEEEEDPLRARVRQIVNDFLTRTWQSASHSISINGLDAITLPSTTQPSTSAEPQHNGEREGIDYTYSSYDGKMQQKVASLYGDLEALTAQVSKLRREAPKSGAEAHQRALMEEMQEDERSWEESKQRAQMAGEREKGVELEDMRDGWHEDVKGMYERGVNELVRVAGLAKDDQRRGGSSLTETVGKVQRARTVAMEFE